MADVKFSALWALTGVVIALITFAAGYWIYEEPVAGYKIVAYPGIVATRLFSEELDFWPKLSVLLGGQYIFCFIALLSLKKFMKQRRP
jgi:hypothetical protein